MSLKKMRAGIVVQAFVDLLDYDNLEEHRRGPEESVPAARSWQIFLLSLQV